MGCDGKLALTIEGSSYADAVPGLTLLRTDFTDAHLDS
jgi:hypothetical protein